MNKMFGRELVVICNARLAEITADDSAALRQFAECRLVQLGAPPAFGEDVTQRAFQAVLMGLAGNDAGRKPRMVDVTNKPAFMNYMRGIISSLLYALTHKKEYRTVHQVWSDNTPISGQWSPANQAELSDLREQLFPRLRARAPRRLIPTINAWESVFLHSDRIPAPGQRKYVHEVRKLAQRVLVEIGVMRRG
jgi:hypothetical protein